jgi:hypothetical protein
VRNSPRSKWRGDIFGARNRVWYLAGTTTF